MHAAFVVYWQAGPPRGKKRGPKRRVTYKIIKPALYGKVACQGSPKKKKNQVEFLLWGMYTQTQLGTPRNL